MAAVSTALGILVVSTAPARAHAALISSDPEAGVTLPCPGVVRLRFSEPLILDLSTISVVDPTGRT